MSQVISSFETETSVVISDPLVTTVIPTRNRPDLVVRAVRSALGQTYQRLEVVVVIDGPDAATSSMLDSVRDERLRVIYLRQAVGGAEARNVGVQAARGEWIALLDDDDEWLSQKIAVQMSCALRSKAEFPILSSRVIARAPRASYVWPRRLPDATEKVAEYLFCRSSLFQGRGFIQTSTILTRRLLLQMVPFRRGLRKHQDWDWVISASKIPGATLEFCPECLAIYYMDQARAAVSAGNDWSYSLGWVRERRQDVSSRAYAGFLLIVVAEQAAKESTAAEYMALFAEAVRSGSPSPLEIAFFAGMRLIPRAARRRLRAALGGSER